MNAINTDVHNADNLLYQSQEEINDYVLYKGDSANYQTFYSSEYIQVYFRGFNITIIAQEKGTSH